MSNFTAEMIMFTALAIFSMTDYCKDGTNRWDSAPLTLHLLPDFLIAPCLVVIEAALASTVFVAQPIIDVTCST